MPLARGLVLLVLASSLAAVAFAQTGFVATMPREIRMGTADMVIQRVEPEVSREEVAAAVQALVQAAPVCLRWPGMWLDPGPMRSVFVARYDLMARDWGADSADSARARMQAFVDAGFLTARERTDLGPGAMEYTLTAEGASYLRGSPYGGEHPSFCAPSQRRVVEVTAMEPGRYDCGSLRVTFTHTADDWPTWARTDALRQRLTAMARAPGSVATGSVSLSRQWFSRDALPAGRTNGQLVSVCYDARRQRVTGDDLQLALP